MNATGYLKYNLLEVKRVKINEKILKLRKEKNFSQEDLGNKINVSRQTISKWETGESNPDFDKIIPLCEVFSITADELLKDDACLGEGLKKDNTVNKKRKALFICSSLFLYFLAFILLMTLSEIGINEYIYIPIFFTLIAVATVILIYYNITKDYKEKKKRRRNKYFNVISGILGLLTVIIYFIVSFMTYSFEITWIIFIVYALLLKIIELIFILRGDLYEE